MNKTQIFSIRLDDQIRQALDDLAVKHHCSRGRLVRLLISYEVREPRIINPFSPDLWSKHINSTPQPEEVEMEGGAK